MRPDALHISIEKVAPLTKQISTRAAVAHRVGSEAGSGTLAARLGGSDGRVSGTEGGVGGIWKLMQFADQSTNRLYCHNQQQPKRAETDGSSDVNRN